MRKHCDSYDFRKEGRITKKAPASAWMSLRQPWDNIIFYHVMLKSEDLDEILKASSVGHVSNALKRLGVATN